MELTINGKATTVLATELPAVLVELGYGEARIATAVNGEIVHLNERAAVQLNNGDAIEIVAPMQGG